MSEEDLASAFQDEIHRIATETADQLARTIAVFEDARDRVAGALEDLKNPKPLSGAYHYEVFTGLPRGEQVAALVSRWKFDGFQYQISGTLTPDEYLVALARIALDLALGEP